MKFETKRLSDEVDVIAPDGSEIRLLAQSTRASMVHCTLPPGSVSKAVRHKTVDEIWYIAGGAGEVWRKSEETEAVVEVTAGMSLSIPVGTSFQFRNMGLEPLSIVITTVPPWPGMDEADRVPGCWSIAEN